MLVVINSGDFGFLLFLCWNLLGCLCLLVVVCCFVSFVVGCFGDLGLLLAFRYCACFGFVWLDLFSSFLVVLFASGLLICVYICCLFVYLVGCYLGCLNEICVL